MNNLIRKKLDPKQKKKNESTKCQNSPVLLTIGDSGTLRTTYLRNRSKKGFQEMNTLTPQEGWVSQAIYAWEEVFLYFQKENDVIIKAL